MNKRLALLFNILITIAILIAVYFAIRIMLIYLMPFIIAIIFAFLIEPLVKLLTNKVKIPRAIASLIASLTLFLLISIVIFFSFSRLVFELKNIINELPSYYEHVVIATNNIIKEATQIYETLPNDIIVLINEGIANLYNTAMNMINGMINGILRVFTMLPQLFLFLIITFITTYFFSKDKTSIIVFFDKLTPQKWSGTITQLRKEIQDSFVRIIKVQSLLILLTTIFLIVSFVVIGIEYALVLGIVSGILDMLPIIGPTLILIPWIIYSFYVGNVAFAVKLMLVYVLMNVFRQILQTKMMSKGLGMHPIPTLMSLYVGLRLYGIIGLFIGPFIFVVIRSIYKSGLIPKKIF